MTDYKSEEKLSDGTPVSEAYELTYSSEVDAWPVGTKCAVGRSDARGGNLWASYSHALEAFKKNFGRQPVVDRVLFRGAFMTFSCMIEIGETPE